jgi:S-DNA-T family DNA segregation ATPase FtsK/SpoIIIE
MEGKEWSLEITIGKFDDPENQTQMPLKIDFAKDGHLGICGNVVCGKSTMIQTIMFALIQKFSPQAVSIYAIDFSSKMAQAFESAPQVGGVMLENDLEKIGKFFNMIESILEERKTIFKGGNYSQYVRVNGIKYPAIILIIDNYAAMKEKTGEAYEEMLIRLSREGVNYGIYLVVSGAGFGINDIPNRVGENLGTILCLALQDRFAYADLLHNMQIEVMPEIGLKGRGLAYYGKRILEYQTALAVPAENDYQRMEIIEGTCRTMADRWTGRPARRIPEIPEKPVWSEFIENDEFDNKAESNKYLPIGYDKANASIYGISLRYNYCWLVWGMKRTGKTNLMRVCIQSALLKESRLIIIDSPDKDYELYKKEENVTYAADEQEIYDAFVKLLPVFKERNKLKQSLLAQDLDEDEIFEIIAKEIPYFIFVADLTWFVPFIYGAKLDMRGFLENITDKGQLHNIYFISEVSLDKKDLAAGYPIFDHMAGYQTGIHLGGKVSDNPSLSYEYLSFMEQSKTRKVGIGQLPDSSWEETTSEIVIPLARR